MITIILIENIIDETHRKSQDLDALAENIRENGLLSPITVCKIPAGYYLLEGHRRLEAIKRLGWKTIPSTVINDVAVIRRVVKPA